MNLAMTAPILDWKKLRDRRLYLASMAFNGKLDLGFHISTCSLVSLCMTKGIHLRTKIIGNESLVTRGRNNLADLFLSTDSTDLLFVDSDITFIPEDALTLLSLDYPIVGGFYPHKHIDWTLVERAVKQGVPATQLPSFTADFVLNWKSSGNLRIDEIHEVQHLGTGFLRIRREVFERMISFYGDDITYDRPAYDPRPDRKLYNFFSAEIDKRHPVGSGRRQYLSEDWWFAERAIACGYRLYGCPWMRLVHTGPYDYLGDMLTWQEYIYHKEEED